MTIGVPVTSGVVAEYQYNEGTGTIVHDSSGNTFDATTGGTNTSWSTQGMVFPGSTGIGLVNSTLVGLLAGKTGLTVQVVYLTNPTVTNNDLNYLFYSSSSFYGEIRSSGGGETFWPTVYTSVKNTYAADTNTLLQNSSWYLSELVWDGTNLYSYTNNDTGKSSGLTGTLTGSSSNAFYMGAVNNTGNDGGSFKGTIAYVVVYNRALSAAERQQNQSYFQQVMWGRGNTSLMGYSGGSSNPTPINANGAFQGQGSLSATANIVNPATINATASFTGQGSLTATASLISPVVATASMQGQGSLTATGNGVWLGSANLTGQGSLSSNPVVVLTASASLSGQGSLTAVVELRDTSVIGTANFYGSSSVVSNPTVSKAPIIGSALFSGQGSLATTVEVIDIGVANLQGTSYLMANAVLPSQVQVPKVWNVVFDPKKSWTGVFDKTVHTWTGVFDPKKVWVGGE